MKTPHPVARLRMVARLGLLGLGLLKAGPSIADSAPPSPPPLAFAAHVLPMDPERVGQTVIVDDGKRPDFDAWRLRTGTFDYRDSSGGRTVGQSRIDIRRADDSGEVRFSSFVSGLFSQQWDAVATRDFAPISARLSFGGDRLAFDLRYAAGRVTGFAVDRKGPRTGLRRALDDAVPASVVDQRIDWAAVSASDLEPGRHFEFEVYDPGTGLSRVSARVGRIRTLHVPAGRFRVHEIVYQIDKRSGPESYRVFVCRDGLAMLVREEFPDGTVSDLAATSPSLPGGHVPAQRR